MGRYTGPVPHTGPVPSPAQPRGTTRRPLGGRLAWLTLLVLPAATVLLVGFAWLVAAAPSSFVYARLIGGPTDAEGPWTGRVQVVERDGGVERPAARTPVRVAWLGGPFEWRGSTDDEGWADVELDRPSGARELAVDVFAGEGPEAIARGRVQLSAEEWLASARRRSGRLAGRTEGALRVGVTVSGGVLAVPFAGQLEIDVQGAEGPARDVELRWSGSHLEVAAVEPLHTDEAGRAHLVVVPRGHTASLELRAEGPSGRSGRWFSTLPVVPGAMRAERAGDQLHIRSPLERERAWYTWVIGGRRLGGGSVSLRPDGSGGAVGQIAVPEELRQRAAAQEAWIVLSSEPDARSPAAVGWPLGEQAETLDVPEHVLLDGAADGEARAARERARLRWVIGSSGALATFVVLVLFAGRVRADRLAAVHRLSELSEEERVADAASVGDTAGWRLWVALLCLALGLALVTLVGLLGER